ncbi:hypothetical protein AAC387_Pa02g3420 [Persea americana]
MGTGMQKMMKRRKKLNTITRNILSLPHEMLASILASVASSSIIDLVDAKLVCKQFSEAALDYLVFKRVTLETIPSTSWTERSPQKSYFLKHCEEAKNPDALYNLGMYHYFSYRDFELGYNLLKNSADSGHLPSIYALGMILVSEKKSQHERCRAPSLSLLTVTYPEIIPYTLPWPGPHYQRLDCPPYKSGVF